MSRNVTYNIWVINYNPFKTGSLTDVPFNKMVSFRDSRMVSLDHFQSSSKTGSILTYIQFNELGYGDDYMADIRRGYCDFWDEIDEYMEH